MLAEQYLRERLQTLPEGAKVLDVGCGDCSLALWIENIRPDLEFYGVDIARHGQLPGHVTFSELDLDHDSFPYEENTFDLVYSRHVLEHLHNPIAMFGEMCRVAKEGGIVFVEAPSDRSTWFSFPWAQHWHLILSFYDDPTHIGRPWSPQALYRLGRCWGMTPCVSRYETTLRARLLFLPQMLWGWLMRDPDRIVETWWHALGWVAYSAYRKPLHAHNCVRYSYISYRGCQPGAPMSDPLS